MSEVNSVKDTGEMMNDLEEYYEAAGFAAFHKNVLSTMDEAEIQAYYHETFETEEDGEREEWEEDI